MRSSSTLVGVSFLASACGASSPAHSALGSSLRETMTSTVVGPAVGRVGDEAHRFFLRTLNPRRSGLEILDLNEIVGPSAPAPRTLVISFAAWSCAPCKRELAAWSEQCNRLIDTEALVAVVLIDDSEADADEMASYLIDDIDLPFPIVRDGFQLVARKYGVRSLPHTAIIGPQGFIRKVSTGYRDDQNLEALLGDIAKVR